MTEQPPEVAARAGAALGKRPVTWERPECGLSAAQRWVVRFADGTSAFVKAATDAATAAWLVNECRVLTLVGERFGPAVIDWLDDCEYPVLITEDLSDAYWPAGTGVVHWRPGDTDAVLVALEQLRTLPSVEGLAAVALPPPAWERLLAAGDLVRVELCTPTWVLAHGSALMAADTDPTVGSASLVHGDVRSDNLCLCGDGQVRFVDWSHAGSGHPFHDRVALLPTLRLEGGPPPSAVLTGPIDLIVRMAGSTVMRAARDTSGPAWLHEVMLRLAVISLGWVCDVLDLAPPDGVCARSINN